MDDFEGNLSNLSYSCPNITEEEIDFLYFTNWFLNGIIQLIICLPGNNVLLQNLLSSRSCDNDVEIFSLGILGNVAAILLLYQKQFSSCFFNQLLVVLASYDLLYLISMALNSAEILINSSGNGQDLMSPSP